jgi:hypothetical protein
VPAATPPADTPRGGVRISTDEKGESVIDIDSDFTHRVEISQTHQVGSPTVTTIVVTPPVSAIHRPSLSHVIGYAILSLVFLGVALVAGWWAITGAPTFGAQFAAAYYIAVVVLGISAAFALFGCMRSYAHVSGKQGSLTAEVGGPAALFVLVVAGAFYLTRPPDTFSLIIRVGSEIDATALQGVKVTVDLGDRREPKEFSATGEAEIHGVSALLVGKQVPIHLSLSRLHLNTTTVLIPPDHIINLEVTADPPSP